jgi:HSP20 family molecular chaperone IbpA
VLVVGEKERPGLGQGPASFHLVERDFGRFVRAVRVHAAVDAARARARLADGELRIALPKIQDRRGQEYLVAVETGSGPLDAAPGGSR